MKSMGFVTSADLYTNRTEDDEPLVTELYIMDCSADERTAPTIVEIRIAETNQTLSFNLREAESLVEAVQMIIDRY